MIIRITLTVILALSFISSGAQQLRVGIIDEGGGEDLQQLVSVITSQGYQPFVIPAGTVAEFIGAGDSLDVIWLQYDQGSPMGDDRDITPGERAVLEFVSRGGGLVLAHQAVTLLNRWEIEPNSFERVTKRAADEGYGRMLGFHAYRSHPLFDGLNGGAYVLKPEEDTTVVCYGFFEERIPDAGKVAAVDWDYIFLRENKKLVTEYRTGKGTILAIGAYMHFSLPNRNRAHLEKFTGNVIRYLASDTAAQTFYWHYGKTVIEEFAPLLKDISHAPSQAWPETAKGPSLENNYGRDEFWDLAGRRIIVMGKESGGIEEIWTHPFMALRDYEAGIRFSYHDSIYWLNDQVPEVIMEPATFTRQYKFRRGFLREVVTASHDRPAGVIHYEYRGVYPAELIVRFRSNLRLMWPYSADVTGGIYYGWSENARAFVISDPSGDFVSILGSNQYPSYHSIGKDPGKNPADSLRPGVPDDQMMVSGVMVFSMEMNHDLDIVTAAGNEGMAKASEVYGEVAENPREIPVNSVFFWENFLDNSLIIESPDPLFNEGYLWALLATERFFQETPGLGTSLTAGYATTRQGWGGGHEISGRPGYAWYFGRDAQWSAFAVLGYGGHEGTREVLETFNKFQDLTGKIYHEMSTTGFVHYDASDATPLYLVLAGRYLQHTGDKDFIDATWGHIRSAIDFCYGTDTDGDLLIENTNVGHGWVEGGSLFGSHTSLYLASCWAAALEASAYMAEQTGRTQEASGYRADAIVVRQKINDLYWDAGNDFFYHGMKKDGTFITEPTIMPAIPLLFGQVEEDKVQPLLNAYARNAFTSDWGCRIVSEFSPLFNPKGYHTGSVWPLYTGWAALAEYRNGNYSQGYFHLMNNLGVYDDWGHGFVEEVLNGEEYLPSGVCHHQCWSETMVIQPAIEGMLGFRPDALNDRFILEPRLPAHWDSLHVMNIRSGSEVVDFSMVRHESLLTYTFTVKEGDGTVIWFNPALLPGTRIKDAVIRETGIKPARRVDTRATYPVAEFILHPTETVTLDISFEGGIAVIPPVPVVKPGFRSKGFRIAKETWQRGEYRVLAEGRSNSREYLEIISFTEPQISEGATIVEKTGENRYRLQVDFPDRETDYADQWIIIKTR